MRTTAELLRRCFEEQKQQSGTNIVRSISPNQGKVLISSGFNRAFTMRWPSGTTQTFQRTEASQDIKAKVIAFGGKCFLVFLNSRQNDRAEVGRQEIPDTVMVAYIEGGTHGEWRSAGSIAREREKE